MAQSVRGTDEVEERLLQRGKKVDDRRADSLHDEVDVLVRDIESGGNNNVVAAVAINCTSAGIHIDVVTILQP